MEYMLPDRFPLLFWAKQGRSGAKNANPANMSTMRANIRTLKIRPFRPPKWRKTTGGSVVRSNEFFVLHAVKLGVKTLPEEQFFVGSFLLDLALVEHYDFICPLNGGKSVSNNNSGSSAQHLVDGLANHLLSFMVY